MTKGKFFAIVNPVAGSGRGSKEAPAILAQLRKDGFEIEEAYTAREGDATRLVREAFEKGVRNFISLGGDGTVFEVINGLSYSAARDAKPIRLAIVPLGTGNSFLKDFSSKGDAEHVLKALAADQSRPCDVIEVKHRNGKLHFINIFSIGFVADVAALRNRAFKRFGEAGYVFGVLCELFRLHPWRFPMRLDRGDLVQKPVTFVSVNNSRYTGGKMMMAPEANTADGFADVIEVGEVGRWTLLKAFPQIFRGTHLGHPAVTSQKAKRIDFEMKSEVDCMIDGEVIRLLPERIQVLPGALEVFV